MEGITLKEIFIGNSDGLLEANNENFMKLFYKGNKSYKLLVNEEESFIISGRKGTGKTVLAKFYERELMNKGMLALTENTYKILLCQLREIGRDEIKNYEISIFIKYVIFSEMSLLIIKNKEHILNSFRYFRRMKITKCIEEIQKLLKDRNGEGNYIIREFANEDTELTAASIEGVGAKLNGQKSKKISNNFEKNEYYNIIHKLEEFIILTTEKISSTLMFDDFDHYADSHMNNESFYIFIEQFITVAYECNCLFKSNNRKNKVIVSIRSDIINNLQSRCSNLSKITADCLITINWLDINDYCCPENNMLMDMILTKFQVSNEKLSLLEKSDLFDMFFPMKINNIPTVTYLNSFGQGRPRDIIDMLNIIKREYPDATYFEENYFNATAHDYSKLFKDAVSNEMSLYYDSNRINDCFKIITFMKKIIFTYEDVRYTILHHREFIKTIQDENEFVTMAYRFGVIGNRVKSGKSKYTYFEYYGNSHSDPNIKMEFVVHRGLQKYLIK